MAEKKICLEPNPKCAYYRKYKCCGYCYKCPTERQGLKEGDTEHGTRKKL